GFDLVLEVLEDIVKLDAQFVMLASGDKETEAKFERLHKKHPKHITLVFGFDEELAHMIEAGSDMFLMPSRYEPCGLNQMYSMRYGTVPIVRATGGLDDTVVDHHAGGKGTGFKFEHYDGGELLKAVQRAIAAFQKPDEWKKLMRNGMAQDFSWEHSAKKYIALYRDILKP
ncbi:MAG: glycosyltransferase, partial [Bacteroidota bacterium]